MIRRLLREEDQRWQRYLDTIRHNVTGDARRKNGSFGPRHGLLSLIARTLPMYVYDPEVIPGFPTAFTDGRYVFFNRDFFQRLMREDAASIRAGNRTESLMPVLWHEIAHVICGHTRRHALSGTGAESALLRYFTDLSHEVVVNMLVKNYLNEIQMLPGPVFIEAPGVSDAERARFAGLADTRIARMLMDDALAQAEHQVTHEIREGVGLPLKPPTPTQRSQGNVSAPAIPSQEAASLRPLIQEEIARIATQPSLTPLAPEIMAPDVYAAIQSAQTASGSLDKDQITTAIADAARKRVQSHCLARHPEMIDAMTPQELASLLESLGLQDAMKDLNIAGSHDNAAHDNVERTTKDAVGRSVMEAEHDRRRQEARGAGSFAGNALLSYAADVIAADAKPKLRWTHAATDMIIGSGQQFHYDHDTPIPEFYLDPAEMGTNIAPYEGLEIPAGSDSIIVAIIDTSGSVSRSLLNTFLSETLAIRAQDASAPEVWVVYGDTSVRGTPIRIEDAVDNEGGITVYGLGGTCLEAVLIETLTETLPLHCPDKRIAGVLYLTDTEDAPPRRERLPQALPPVIFLAPDEAHIDPHFLQGVTSYAEVIPIRENMDISFDLESEGGPRS